MRGNARSLAKGADFFLRGGFDANRFRGDPECLGKLLFHACDVRRDFGLLGNQAGIHIDQPVARLGRLADRALEDFLGGDPLDRRIGIGKEVTDIGQAAAAQNGVGNGVAEDIRVGMAVQADLGMNRDAAQGERQARLEPVDIVAKADAERGSGIRMHGVCGEKGFEVGKVGRAGQLRIGKDRFDEEYRFAKSLDSGQVVGYGLVQLGVCAIQQVPGEGLRGFHGPELLPWEKGGRGRLFRGVFNKLANGIGHPMGQGDRTARLHDRFPDGLQGGRGDGRAGAVMDADISRIRRQQIEAFLYGLLPFASAEGVENGNVHLLALDNGGQLLSLDVVAGDNNEGLLGSGLNKSCQHVSKNRLAGNLEKNLVLHGLPHTGTASPCEEDCHMLHANSFDFLPAGKQILIKMAPVDQPVTLTCPAKVNLSLAILGPREDGFHALHSVVAQTSFGDELTLEWNPAGPVDKDVVVVQDALLPEADNSVRRAIQAYRRAAGFTAGAYTATLIKRIPVGAGLGGGSSDAVATLKALRQLHGPEFPDVDWSTLAANLGSDCPLFLNDNPVVMEGRGEQLTPLEPAPHRTTRCPARLPRTC